MLLIATESIESYRWKTSYGIVEIRAITLFQPLPNDISLIIATKPLIKPYIKGLIGMLFNHSTYFYIDSRSLSIIFYGTG